MRRLVLAAAFAALVSPLCAQAPKPDPADKAIADAVAVLEKALAATKDAAGQEKLKAAIDVLKKPAQAAVPAKPQNDLISDFIDNTAKYKGKVVTFQLTYMDNLGTLRDRVGDRCLLKGKDSKNRAELLIQIIIPKGLDVPAAKNDEQVIVTFTCTMGKTEDGNKVVAITRP